jgi:hypothetical protein
VEIFRLNYNHLRHKIGIRNAVAVQHVCHFGCRDESVRLSFSATGGGQKVDLTLRLNVIAVCAAIAFVGAIIVMF